MNKRIWSRQVILRYSLLQLPEVVVLFLILFLLRQWTNIPMWVVWTFTSLFLMTNIILYPFVWRAYDKKHPGGICGSRGIAADRLSPCGYVRINSELWQAKVIEGNAYIEKGDIVKVDSIDGLTLIVQSDTKQG
jgi:membrane-bound ClpP family serine protease